MSERIYCRKCGKDVNTLAKRRHFCRRPAAPPRIKSSQQLIFWASGETGKDEHVRNRDSRSQKS